MSTGRIPTQRQTIGGSTKLTTSRAGTPPAIKQQTEDRQTNKLQRDLASSVAALKAHPHGDGLYIEKGAVWTAGQTLTIQHGLGRAFRGYEVKNVGGNFSRFLLVANFPSSLDSRQIKIQSEAACTGDVWVF